MGAITAFALMSCCSATIQVGSRVIYQECIGTVTACKGDDCKIKFDDFDANNHDYPMKDLVCYNEAMTPGASAAACASVDLVEAVEAVEAPKKGSSAKVAVRLASLDMNQEALADYNARQAPERRNAMMDSIAILEEKHIIGDSYRPDVLADSTRNLPKGDKTF